MSNKEINIGDYYYTWMIITNESVAMRFSLNNPGFFITNSETEAREEEERLNARKKEREISFRKPLYIAFTVHKAENVIKKDEETFVIPNGNIQYHHTPLIYTITEIESGEFEIDLKEKLEEFYGFLNLEKFVEIREHFSHIDKIKEGGKYNFILGFKKKGKPCEE